MPPGKACPERPSTGYKPALIQMNAETERQELCFQHGSLVSITHPCWKTSTGRFCVCRRAKFWTDSGSHNSVSKVVVPTVSILKPNVILPVMLCNRKPRAARAATEFLKTQASVNLTYVDWGQQMTVSCSPALNCILRTLHVNNLTEWSKWNHASGNLASNLRYFLLFHGFTGRSICREKETKTQPNTAHQTAIHTKKTPPIKSLIRW